jgi:hypothetical protein
LLIFLLLTALFLVRSFLASNRVSHIAIAKETALSPKSGRADQIEAGQRREARF